MLLAPPTALPLLGSGSSYGDAVRITPLAASPTHALLARLHPLLPGASSCECGSKGDDGAVVVLPRGLVVALPPPSGVGEPLQPMFQAAIEPVMSR